MRIASTFGLCTALALTSGCFHDGDVVPVNLDFAYTNYGYINSGDFRAGSFLLWNKTEGKMVHLSDIPGFTAPLHPRDKAIQTAFYASGADLGLGGSKGVIQAKADALIAANSSFEIAYPNTVAYDKYLTSVTRYLREDIIDGGDLMDEWGFRDAVKEKNLYYVLIRKVTYGDGIALKVDGEVRAEGGFKVVLKGADVSVALKGKGLNEIRGENTEVAFDVAVLRPYWKNNGTGGQNPAFTPERWIDVSDLPELFRKTAPRRPERPTRP